MRQLCFILVICFVYCKSVKAGQELIVKEKIPVYSSPEEGKKPIYVLLPGQMVPLAQERDLPGWRKVFIEKESTLLPFYIKSRSLKLSRVRFGQENLDVFDKYKKNKSRIGLSFQFVRTYMGEQTVKDSEGLGASFNEMRGSSNFFGFLYQHSLSDRSSFKTSIYFSRYKTSGEGLYDNASAETEVSLDQKMISGQLMYLRYLETWPSTWIGAGAQVGKGTSVQLSIGSEDEDLSGDALPLFGGLVGQIGYDFRIAESWLLSPHISVLYVFNAERKIVPTYFSLALSREL